MFPEVITFSMLVLCTLGQNLTSTNYVFTPILELFPVLNATNILLDGPGSISYASTTPTTNTKPTLDQMQYYNYYAASMYCQYQLSDLSCTTCQNFKGDVSQKKVLMNNDTDISVLITLSNTRKEIVATFRGTQNVWNCVLDLLMFSVGSDHQGRDIKLHQGFLIATLSVYNEVVTNIRKLLSLHSDYKIVIVGHSLGGALARITAYFMLFDKEFPSNKMELYTYGELRHGNKAYVDYMNAQHITTARIIERADIVPHLAPVSVLGTDLLGDYYYHCQTEYWIDGEDNQKFANQSTYTDPTCADSLGPAYSVIDHFEYFNVDYLTCWLNAPLVWAAVPFSILQPVGTIPELPGVTTDVLSALIGLVVDNLGGILG